MIFICTFLYIQINPLFLFSIYSLQLIYQYGYVDKYYLLPLYFQEYANGRPCVKAEHLPNAGIQTIRLPIWLKDPWTSACFPLSKHSGFYFPPFAEANGPPFSPERSTLLSLISKISYALTYSHLLPAINGPPLSPEGITFCNFPFLSFCIFSSVEKGASFRIASFWVICQIPLVYAKSGRLIVNLIRHFLSFRFLAILEGGLIGFTVWWGKMRIVLFLENFCILPQLSCLKSLS